MAQSDVYGKILMPQPYAPGFELPGHHCSIVDVRSVVQQLVPAAFERMPITINGFETFASTHWTHRRRIAGASRHGDVADPSPRWEHDANPVVVLHRH